jgi:DNA modification methylase
LCWDKRTNEFADKMLGSPFELAWTKKRNLFKMVRIMHGGAINADGPGLPRMHSTQKPIALMQWCLGFVSGDVVDPFMGSGTTGIACARMGRKFIGIEIDERYFDIACRRIEDAQRQADLFVKPADLPRAQQAELLP